MKLDYAFVPLQPPVLPANEPSHKRCSPSSKKYRGVFLIGVFFVAASDAVLKYLAVQGYLPKLSGTVIDIAYFANPGIAFSIPLPRLITLIITGVLLCGCTWLFFRAKAFHNKLALGAVLLGAGSNFIDRIITGYTTDYLIFFTTSAINFADILIMYGIAVSAWYHQKAETE